MDLGTLLTGSSAGLVDLLAVLPFWFGFLLPPDFRTLLVLRMIRFLKIARYSAAMRSLLDVLYSERRALLLLACAFASIPTHKQLHERLPDNCVRLVQSYKPDGALAPVEDVAPGHPAPWKDMPTKG